MFLPYALICQILNLSIVGSELVVRTKAKPEITLEMGPTIFWAERFGKVVLESGEHFLGAIAPANTTEQPTPVADSLEECETESSSRRV